MINNYAKKILEESLMYDVGFCDITTEFIIPNNHKSKGILKVKEDSIVCGLDFVVDFLKDNKLHAEPLVNEGDFVKANTNILEVAGSTKKILTVERTILNFLMHLSGIATKTYNIVSIAKKINNKTKIACTRKTHPMLSVVEKYAVFVGGGDTHRFRLDDMIMIKDNHIEAVGIDECFKISKKISFSKKIEIEVDNLEQLKEVLKYRPDIVLLDNFEPEDIKNALDVIDKFESESKYRPLVEISGGITEKNIMNYLKYDIDVVSMGCIIHSARAIDMGLDLKCIE